MLRRLSVGRSIKVSGPIFTCDGSRFAARSTPFNLPPLKGDVAYPKQVS